MGLTLIIMLSKTKKVFTTHLPVLCSIASLIIILSAMWRIERLSLLFVPPTERRRNGDYHDAIVIAGKDEELYQLWKDRLEYILHEFSGFGWGMGDYITEEYYSLPWIEEE